MFTMVSPCNAATDYVTAADNTINFGSIDVVYSPKCLKVTAGATVTFKGFGTESFLDHPLAPSTMRGTLTGNPITLTEDSSTMKAFTFPTTGYYAYFCKIHGFTDSGMYMAGVVWVQ
jgi:plastocyanin